MKLKIIYFFFQNNFNQYDVFVKNPNTLGFDH